MLKRTPFKRKAPAAYAKPEREPKPNYQLTRPFNGAVILSCGNVYAKRAYVRSLAVLEACRLIDCQHCGRAASTNRVVAAHSNWSVHGKGGHIKADDSAVAALCDVCHILTLDQGASLSQDARRLMWWLAHIRTVRQLLHLKLWPADVPVPDIENNPFLLEPA